MGVLTSIWRGRTGRLWRLSVAGVPLVPGGDPEAQGSVRADADLSEPPALEYGEGSRRRGSAAVGSSLTVTLADVDGRLGPALRGVAMVNAGAVRATQVGLPPGIFVTAAPNVTLASGRDDPDAPDGFSEDLAAGRGGYYWAGYLTGRPAPVGDERGLASVEVEASCGLSAWAEADLGVELGVVHSVSDLLVLPGQEQEVTTIALDARPTNIPDGRLHVLPTTAERRADLATALLGALSHRLWRAFDQTGVPATTVPDGWRVSPVWAPPVATAAPLSAGEPGRDADVPAEVSVTEPATEPTHPNAGGTKTPGVTTTADGVLSYVEGLVPNGDVRHWRDGVPVGFSSGGAVSRVVEGGRYAAELGAGGWLWREAWPVDPGAAAAALSDVGLSRADRNRDSSRSRSRRPAQVELSRVRASLRVKLSGDGAATLRLFVHGADGTWYAGADGGGWTPLAAPPTPGDVAPGTGAVLRSSGRKALLPAVAPPAGRLFVEVARSSGAPRVQDVACLISVPDDKGGHEVEADGGRFAVVDRTEAFVRLGGSAPPESLGSLPPAYASGAVDGSDDDRLDRPLDPGEEASTIASATSGVVYPGLGTYALALAAAVRGTPGEPPAVESRDAFGIVTPDHLVVSHGLRYAVQAGRVDLRDEVTEKAVLLQVPVWTGAAWSFAPQL